jgi:hypothetical protein
MKLRALQENYGEEYQEAKNELRDAKEMMHIDARSPKDSENEQIYKEQFRVIHRRTMPWLVVKGITGRGDRHVFPRVINYSEACLQS